jgi:hypothetical protein
MNKIYSNIKKIALSLLVVGLAISTQAFKGTEINNSKLTTTYYLNVPGLSYERYDGVGIPDIESNCGSGDSNSCVVQTANDEGASFLKEDISEVGATPSEGSDPGYYSN